MRDIARAQALVASGAITERRNCLSKVSYALKNDAIHAAKLVGQKKRRTATTHACTFCRGWHITVLKHSEEE